MPINHQLRKRGDRERERERERESEGEEEDRTDFGKGVCGGGRTTFLLCRVRHYKKLCLPKAVNRTQNRSVLSIEYEWM